MAYLHIQIFHCISYIKWNIMYENVSYNSGKESCELLSCDKYVDN